MPYQFMRYMKKLFYYIIPLIAVGGFIWSCDTDDVEFEGVGINASPFRLEFETSAKMLPFRVTATTDWTVGYRDAEDETWVTFTPDSGTGLSEVRVSVAANTGARREAVLVVSNGEYSDSVYVVQTGVAAGI